MNVLTLPRYLTYLPTEHTNISTITAFHHHPEIPLIIDTLSRYQRHHLLLIGTPSNKINQAIIESTMAHLTSPNHAKSLQDAHFFYCDVNQLFLEEKSPEAIEKELAAFKEEARNTQKTIILIMDQIEPLIDATEHTHQFLKSLLFDNQWRLMIFADPIKFKRNLAQLTQFETYFSTIQLSEPSEPELLSLLKFHRAELENFHQVTLPDDVLSSALTITYHYLYSASHFDKALELLDSSSSRTSKLEKADNTGQFKPIVTNTILAEVVSSLTHIPSSHIQNNKFQANLFQSSIEQHIFGQEKALASISSTLQQSYIKLHEKKGPLCSFLFVGPTDVGKTELTQTMAKYLFGHENAFIPITLDKSFSSLTDIKISTHANQYSLNLLEAIRQTPYAIILIDDIQPDQMATLELFNDIFTQGFVIDQNEKYDFSHAIVIAATRIGSQAINLMHPQQQPQNTTPDLLQLVLNENILDIPSSDAYHSHSMQEIYDQVLPELNKHFSTMLLQKTHVIPFSPLDFSALEKIIRLKIKSLIKTLASRFEIELNYAPEVLKFLAHEAYWQKSKKSLEKILDQLLYSCVAHTLLAHNQDKNRFNRLLLQLNEQGQLLKCEFMTEASVHRI